MAAKTLSAADGKVQAYDPIWSEIRREATSGDGVRAGAR